MGRADSLKEQSLATCINSCVPGVCSGFTGPGWGSRAPYPAVKALICLPTVVLMQLGGHCLPQQFVVMVVVVVAGLLFFYFFG